jgi:hypothetical protein
METKLECPTCRWVLTPISAHDGVDEDSGGEEY